MRYPSIILCILFLITNNIFGQGLDSVFKSYEVEDVNSTNIVDILKSKTNGPININLLGLDLELVHSDIFSNTYTSLKSDGSQVDPMNRAIPMNGFTSKGGRVSLSFAPNFIYGYFEKDDKTYYIEPTQYYNKSLENDSYVIYKKEDIINDTEYTCAPIEIENTIKNNNYPSKMTGVCYDVEYAICNDYSMILKYTNAAGAENHAIGVTNNVNTSYDDEFDDEIHFSISGQYNSTCNGCDPWTASTDASVLLEDFRVWSISNLSISHDIASLWTNRDFDGSTIGLAYVGGMCNNSFKYNILQDWDSNADLKRVMVAHELGHNLNAQHDASGSNTIMAPSVNNTTTWSATSISTIETFYGGLTCLAVCAGSTPQVQFETQFKTVGESSDTGSTGNCSEPFELVPLNINMNVAPSANVVITASINGALTTAVEGRDFELVNTSVTFTPSGSLTQSVDIRILNDLIEEISETIEIELAISSGTATLGPFDSQTITIEDTGDEVSSMCCSGGGSITYGSYNYNATTIFQGAVTDSRSRVIILASELTAAGLSAGTLDQLSLNVATKNSTSPFNDFRIGLANVANSDLTGMSWIGTTEVYSANTTTTTGWNDFEFSNNFNWDGTSNLYITFCFNNTVAVGEDIIQHTIPTNATSTQMTQYQIANGTDGCDAIGTNTTYNYTVAIQPRLQIRTVSGAIVETGLNATASGEIEVGETAHFYTGDKVIASVKNVGSTNISCSDVTIKTAGSGQETAGFGSGDYTTKTFEVTGNAAAEYEVTLYFTDAELNIWGGETLNLYMVKSDITLANATEANVVINEATATSNIGAGNQISYTSTFIGPGFFALTDVQPEIIYGTIENADLVINEINRGVVLHTISNVPYRITATNANTISLAQTTGTIEASFDIGDINIPSSALGIILRKPDGSYARLKVDNDGVPFLQAVTLPASKIELETGDFAILEGNKGVVLKNTQNECYRLTINSEVLTSTSITCF